MWLENSDQPFCSSVLPDACTSPGAPGFRVVLNAYVGATYVFVFASMYPKTARERLM